MAGNAKGTTLLEALVGVFLLMLVLLGVMPLFVQTMRYNAAADDLGTVVNAAVERMERIRGEPYDGLVAGGSLTAEVTVAGVDYFDVSDPRYILRWQIVDNAVPQGGKRVEVRALALRQVSGRPKEALLTSIRAGL